MEKDDYVKDLCRTFQNEIKTRKTLQEEGNKPPGLRCLVVTVTLNIPENSKAHFTTNYEQCSSAPLRLVIRRGFPFSIVLHCDRPYDKKVDVVIVELTYGLNPTIERGTKKLLRAEQTDDSRAEKLNLSWNARIKETRGCDLHLAVNTPPDCAVGEWKLKIQTGVTNNDDITSDINAYTSFVCLDFLFILFNPWCCNDTVYIPDPKGLNEYVLNDTGSLWQGANRQVLRVPWNFGQFEDVSLYAALTILRMSDITYVERKDVVLTVRKLTEAVNGYVLMGKWIEPYDDGTKPLEWTGSVEIMEKFMKDPTTRVKYGQCWVFSGVLVTLCRTLGIPCRSITNMNSAHDTDKTLTVDHVFKKSIYDENFKLEKSELIWNYHVWNEAWMQRLDLPPGYDGWQACDATRQELSEGRFQCGPMSLKALREGKVDLNYDGWFIYGEVNADVIKWFYKADLNGGWKLLDAQIDAKDVGTCTVTTDYENPLKWCDVTLTYKPAEDTNEEREHFRSAVRAVVAKERTDILKQLYRVDKIQRGDVSFTLKDIDMIAYGEKFSSLLTIKNESRSTRTAMVTTEMHVVSYNGIKQDYVAGSEKQLKIEAKSVIEVALDCDVNYYGMKLKEHNGMSVEVVARVLETGQIYSDRDLFLIRKPSLNLSCSKRARINQPIDIDISFTNPCNYQLTNCQIKVGGTGLGRIFSAENVKMQKQIKPGKKIQTIHPVVPRKTGKKSLVAVFTSDQLSDIRGNYSFNVD